MYTEAKQYLLEQLKGAGLKSKPHTAEKTLARSQESHVGAVIFESETFSRNGSKTHYCDKTGAQKKRRKVFDRKMAFAVVIGDYTDEAVETMLERFLSNLGRGIMVDGNYVPIEVDGTEWVDTEDTFLKAKVAVKVTVRFEGGIYRDTDFAKVSELEIESVTKHREEPIDGD